MKFYSSALFFLIMGLSGCFWNDVIQYDEKGFPHRTPHYLSDKVGQKIFPEHIEPDEAKRLFFDPKASSWAAYNEKGERVMTGRGSAGKDDCEGVKGSCRTVSGEFKIYLKGKKNCRSGQYPLHLHGGALMPYCMYFHQGFTIHAAYDVPSRPSSHGCIRVWPSAAQWLNEEFVTAGTKVIVLSYS